MLPAVTYSGVSVTLCDIYIYSISFNNPVALCASEVLGDLLNSKNFHDALLFDLNVQTAHFSRWIRRWR